MQKIESAYIQEVQTIHPELILNVHFWYDANVHDDEGETVDIICVYLAESGSLKMLNIDAKTPSIERFLAHIREDARAKAYQQRKQAKI